jgi:hypothetical protein
VQQKTASRNDDANSYVDLKDWRVVINTLSDRRASSRLAAKLRVSLFY